jgi:lipopolysaccharide transport system ATP-binding protein
MGKKVISVENVSKVYRLGEIGTGTLSSDVNRWWVTKVLGKEDPYLKIGQVNDRATKGDTDVVYSLKDISFDVEQGEVLGIIGKNGAGKSTLLKILSRITSPTTGRVRMKGRVASLLEVGTGFHPELTGRENIFLNGSILGMRKHEIARKLDEIIEFSGVERYIDTPVKRYSSGMYVRLAFAVAAHLESEILIVDEVLAVGDAEFQNKCLGRMKDVSVNEGRTVLFVSHNLPSLRSICTKGILLDKGTIAYHDHMAHVVSNYLLMDGGVDGNTIIPSSNSTRFISFDVKFIEHQLDNDNSVVSAIFSFKIFSDNTINDVSFGIGVDDAVGHRLITFYSHYHSNYFEVQKGESVFDCVVDSWPLRPGRYFLTFSMDSNNMILDHSNKGVSFDCALTSKQSVLTASRMDHTQGHFIIGHKWRKNNGN